MSSYGARAIVDNNLVVGFSFGLLTGTCQTSAATEKLPAEVKNNAFVATSPVVVRIAPPGDCLQTPKDTATLTAAEAALGDIASGNVALLPTCDANARCRPCSAGGCTGDVLADASLLTGWPLPNDAWCKITNGGIDLGPSVDATNAARTVPFSIGAREQDSTTCTP